MGVGVTQGLLSKSEGHPERYEFPKLTKPMFRPHYSDFLDLEVPREKNQNQKNYPKLASDSSGTLKIGFSVKFYIYI